jgi:hypothetical protein
MAQFPKEPRKIKRRINSYKRKLRQEQMERGTISDGYGKRYLIGPLYLVLGDLQGAVAAFEWFEETFPEDVGEPFHCLCWALALYRSGDVPGATRKLLEAMLSNVYMIPHLLGIEQRDLDLWHGSNWEEKRYLQYAPDEIWSLWDKEALDWARETYTSEELRRVRAKYITLSEELKTQPTGSKRHRLVSELLRLRRMDTEQ